MVRTMRPLIVALMLAGCGPMPAESDGGSLADAGACVGATREALSGTRLKARYVVGDDGSRSPLGFFDTARSEACTFQNAEDGKLRCLPTDDLAAVLPKMFVDSACRIPAAYTATCPNARYAIDFTATCPTRMRVFNITPATITAVYSGDPGATCTASVKNSGSYFAISGSAAPDQWVAGAVKVDP